MGEHGEVYDLGAINPAQAQAAAIQVPRVSGTRGVARPAVAACGDPGADWVGSLSLFLPGGTHLLRGQAGQGFFFQVTACFVVALAWAILDSLDRLGPNLELLGLPADSAVWALGVLFIAATTLHITNLITAPASYGASRGRHRGHPLVTGTASFLLPGWGQMLRGDRSRAVPFVVGLWVVAGSWILVSPAAQALLAEKNMVLPPWLVVITSPVVRWTLPAVIWALAVHDAVVRTALPSWSSSR